MNALLALPVFGPLTAAAVLLLLRCRRTWQHAVSLLTASLLLILALLLLGATVRNGVLATQIGGWPAPYGITLVADVFSAIMVVLSGLLGFAAAVYSLATIGAPRQDFGYFPLFFVLLAGVNGSFLTGDIFNLYVWVEVMLMASFMLMTLGGEQPQLEGGIKYVTLNLIASAFLLAGVGILYGKTGTLNMADLAYKLSQAPRSDLVNSSAMLFLMAFGIKAAIFPLFFWLPASYHTPPPAVSAFFAGLLTKVGVYAILRTFTLVFVQDSEFTLPLILILSGLTMVTGVLGAVAQMEMRRLLSFHIISQIGYVLMGLGLATVLSLAGAIFFLFHVAVAKAALFLVAGAVSRLSGTGRLEELGGIFKGHPSLGYLFLIPALSLAGLPPLSGFWAKYVLVKAGLEVRQYALVAVALAVSLLTLFSMLKLWSEAFWKPAPAAAAPFPDSATPSRRREWTMLFAIALLAAVTVAMGLGAGPLFALALKAADQMLHPAAYVQTVLGVPLP